MSTKLKEIVLKDAEEFASAYVQVAMGRGVMTCTDKKIRDDMWDLVKLLVLQAGDVTQVQGLSEGSISDRVDRVLEQVAQGLLTIQQGKRLIEMLQAGFEITELPKLIEALNKAEQSK